ncbi:MAG: hypothetical protein OXG96_09430 [Acidobacteria bacterium]|nr:hypothetical protein [Acidobacteriota bacterium]
MRSYLAFLFKIPEDYRGVAGVTWRDRRLVIRELGGNSDRDLSMTTGAFPP